MGCGESKHAVATENSLSRRSSRASSRRESRDKNNSKNNNVNNNENAKEVGGNVAGNGSDIKGKAEKVNMQEQNNASEKRKEAEEKTGEIVSEGKISEKSQGGKGEKLKEDDEVNVAADVKQESAPAVENKGEIIQGEIKAVEKSNQAAAVEQKTGEIVSEKKLPDKSETGKEEKAIEPERKTENETQGSLKENNAAVAEEKEPQQEIKVVNHSIVADEKAATKENKAANEKQDSLKENDAAVAEEIKIVNDATITEEKAQTKENKAENEQENTLKVNEAAAKDTEPPQERKIENPKENVEKVKYTADTQVSISEGEKDFKAVEVQTENSPGSSNATKTE